MIRGTWPFASASDSTGDKLALDLEPGFWAVITANSTGAYSFYELSLVAPGLFSIDIFKRSGNNAYEVTGNANVPIGSIVYLRPGYFQGGIYSWEFWFPVISSTHQIGIYAKLTNSAEVSGIILYDWREQVMNGTVWENGTLTGLSNAREFNNNNITIGTVVHLFPANYTLGGGVSVAYLRGGDGVANTTIQTVSVVGTGTFQLTAFNGTVAATTAAIAANASTAAVESALESLSNVGNVTVTGAAGSYTVTFEDSFALYPLLRATTSLIANQTYVFNSDAGNGSTPGSVTTNFLTVNVNTTLYGTVNIYANTSLNITGNGSITLNGQNQTGFWAKLLNANGTGANRIYSWNESLPSSDNTWIEDVGRVGTLKLSPAWERNNFNAPLGSHVWMYGAEGTTGTVTINGSAVDWTIIVKAGGGTFTLTVDNVAGTETTGALAYDIDAATLQAALEALTNVGAAGVTVTGFGTVGSPFIITFVDAIIDFTADNDALQAYVSVVFDYETSNGTSNTTPGSPNLSIQFNHTGQFRGLQNMTANLTHNIAQFIGGGIKPSSMLGTDAGNTTMSIRPGYGLEFFQMADRNNATLNVTLQSNGTPGQPNQSIQYNNGGVFGGFGNFNSTSNLTTLPDDLFLATSGGGFLFCSAIAIRAATSAPSPTVEDGMISILSYGTPTWGWEITAYHIGADTGGGLEWSGNTTAGPIFVSDLIIRPAHPTVGHSRLKLSENGTVYAGLFTSVIGLKFVGGALVENNLSINISDIIGLQDALDAIDARLDAIEATLAAGMSATNDAAINPNMTFVSGIFTGAAP